VSERLALTLDWQRPAAADGSRRVVATGVFDVLHVGHIRFLERARNVGTSLIVGVESDARVVARKGGVRPIVPARERCEILAALRAVDGVFLVEGPAGLWAPDAYAAMMRPVRPAVLALTAGDPAGPGKRDAARQLGAEVVVVPRVEGWSTSALLERAGGRTRIAAREETHESL